MKYLLPILVILAGCGDPTINIPPCPKTTYGCPGYVTPPPALPVPSITFTAYPTALGLGGGKTLLQWTIAGEANTTIAGAINSIEGVPAGQTVVTDGVALIEPGGALFADITTTTTFTILVQANDGTGREWSADEPVTVQQ